MAAMDARGVALRALLSTLDGAALESAFGEAEGKAALEARDRGFARLLVLTTLRRLGQIDAVIGHCVTRPDGLPLPEHGVLRLGAAQLLFLGTPAHAAVSASVDAARSATHKGLVNAVLRRISREGAALVATQDAARLNTPGWLWKQLLVFGPDTARAIADAHLQEPPLDLSVARDAADWAARLEAEILPIGSLRLRRAGIVSDLPGYADGGWWVQDAAAALPARLLLNRLDSTGQARVADLCAAPGGKTAQLAAAGTMVTAVDRDPKRLERVRENLRRLRLDATLVAADAATWSPPAQFDGVLLDAPCTATGTLRRNPDIAWHKGAGSAAALNKAQDLLLDAAARILKPGGVMVYCVCSLDRREGAARIEALMHRQPDLRRVPIAADEVGGLGELVNPDGDLRTLPCHLGVVGGMDGFYAARLVRGG